MGFFDRLTGKKPEVPASLPPAEKAAAPEAGGTSARLTAARERLEAKDLPGAMAIYEEVLASAGDRPDVLVAISGDLGVTGNVNEIIELVAPRYDAERHGPATGLNLLQAYLAVRNTDAAQHVLDILFSLNRPELEERLYGFSNAIAEQLHSQRPTLEAPGLEPEENGDPQPEAAKLDLVSISKPIWYYGLEPLEPRLLPAKASRPRRIAFAQLALMGVANVEERAKQPPDELTDLCRAFPLWLAETFSFSAHYEPLAAVGVFARRHYALFAYEWTPENLRQLANSSGDPLDYVFTGTLTHRDGDYMIALKLWEVKKFRERKQFTLRWTPATADAELAKFHEQIRTFMEWTPAVAELNYASPAAPRAWLDTLALSITLFLGKKGLLPREVFPDAGERLGKAGASAANSESASLAWLTARHRAEKLEVASPLLPALAETPLVSAAKEILR